MTHLSPPAPRLLGAKNVLSAGLLGNAVVMLLLPLAAARGVYYTSALLVFKGVLLRRCRRRAAIVVMAFRCPSPTTFFELGSAPKK